MGARKKTTKRTLGKKAKGPASKRGGTRTAEGAEPRSKRRRPVVRLKAGDVVELRAGSRVIVRAKEYVVRKVGGQYVLVPSAGDSRSRASRQRVKRDPRHSAFTSVDAHLIWPGVAGKSNDEHAGKHGSGALEDETSSDEDGWPT